MTSLMLATVSRPTLAKNARTGHPLQPCRRKPIKTRALAPGGFRRFTPSVHDALRAAPISVRLLDGGTAAAFAKDPILRVNPRGRCGVVPPNVRLQGGFHAEELVAGVDIPEYKHPPEVPYRDLQERRSSRRRCRH